MKKHVIAVAVVGAFTVPAIAQVTIDGIVDMSTGSVSKFGSDADAISKNNVNTNLRSSSQLRIRATEDLGGGMKAGVTLVQDLAAMDNKSDASFNRGAFVSLSGNFGEFKLGAPDSTFMSGINTYGSYGGNVSGLRSSNGISNSVITALGGTQVTSRPNNSITYNSPSFNGISAQIVHGYNTTENSANTAETKKHGDVSMFSLSGKVGAFSFTIGTATQKAAVAAVAATNATAVFLNNGTATSLYTSNTAGKLSNPAFTANSTSGWNVVTGYTVASGGSIVGTLLSNGTDAVAAYSGKIENFGMGLSYDLGAVQVSYSFLDGKITKSNVAAEVSKYRSQGINAQMTMGALQPFANYRTFEDKTAGASEKDHTGMTIGVGYILSKRTNIYALYDVINNETASQAGAYGQTRAKAGNDPKTIAIGVRHSF